MTETTGRVLVVDDEPAIRKVIAVRLRSAGFEVDEAPNGTSGLDQARSHIYDVMVLDVMMPDLDGYGVLDALRSAANAPSVIFLSAHAERNDRLRGLYGGAVDFVGKPFDAEELVARVAAAAREKKKSDAFREASRRDALTGLQNRLSFDLTIEAEIKRSIRYHSPLALVLLDADGLKSVNDTGGHSAGDAYLCAIARAIDAACRETDQPSRIGGDEFAVVLPETNRSQGNRFIKRLCVAASTQRVEIAGKSRAPSLSIGMAVFPEDGRNFTALFETADAALYRAKAELKAEGADRENAPDLFRRAIVSVLL